MPYTEIAVMYVVVAIVFAMLGFVLGWLVANIPSKKRTHRSAEFLADKIIKREWK